MKILSHNDDPEINVENVEFQSIIDANYKDIVNAFGEPMTGDRYMTDVQWKLKFVTDGGMKFTGLLYNYKTGKSYLGDAALDMERNPNWNVASSRKDVNIGGFIERYLQGKKVKI